ncbi:MAG: tetratricopeptide repeat protein, partial [Actinobacteria bacterium]|nr:tetratricopeptide repeat protein [Actinomycetota bacterium]
RRDRPRREAPRAASKYEPVHLPDDVVKELHAMARPGKGEILVKVFADAAAAFQAGDFDEAIKLGDQAKHMALRAVSIREFLGLAYYHQGRWQEAARELAAFRRISGSTEQNPVLADSYRAMGKPEKAIDYVDEIERGRVPDAVFYEGAIVAAGALADAGKIDDAIARLESLDLRPKTAEDHHLRAWYMLGDLLARKGRFTQARDWFEAVASADPDATDAPERLARLR